jgi:hypothetical protein
MSEFEDYMPSAWLHEGLLLPARIARVVGDKAAKVARGATLFASISAAAMAWTPSSFATVLCRADLPRPGHVSSSFATPVEELDDVVPFEHWQNLMNRLSSAEQLPAENLSRDPDIW